jgi:hypothetical protein
MHLRLSVYAAGQRPQTLRIAVNGTELQAVRAAEDARLELAVPVSGRLRAGDNRITLRLDHLISPAELQRGADPRRLGLALHALGLE